MALKIVYNDICRERTDVLVTPASRFPRVGTGLDRAVHEAAGERLLEAREKLGNIGPGTLGVSPAFGLREKTGAKYVIHALGPIWSARAGIREELILGGCYFRIFLKAVELGCKTVTVPILSSGRFGMPMGNALKVAVESAETFLLAFPGMTVKLVGVDSDFLSCARGLYSRYLAKSAFTESEAAKLRAKAGSRTFDFAAHGYDDFTSCETDPYFDQQRFEHETDGKTFKQLFIPLWNAKVMSEKAEKRKLAKLRGTSRGGRRLLITNRDLADATGISERTIRNFCAVGSGSDRTSKDKIFALSVAMGLSIRYTMALLATCGYRFETTPRDEAVYDAIESGCHDVLELNMKLDGLRLPLLDV